MVRLEAGGVCGSDVPKFVAGSATTTRDRDVDGFPLHEVCGVVVASATPGIEAGDRVVGHCPGSTGLRELLCLPADHVARLPPGVTAREGVVVQPLAAVLAACRRLPDPADRMALVIGQGPIGLLFVHILSHLGAIVDAVDPVDHSELAHAFGARRVAVAKAEDRGAGGPVSGYDVCVEAAGHQQDTLVAAIDALAPRGTIYAFGVPHEGSYRLPFRSLFDKAGTILTGVTQNWQTALAEGAEYLRRHPDLLGPPGHPLITHAVPLAGAQQAYELSARTDPTRRKVIIDAVGDQPRSVPALPEPGVSGAAR